MRNSNIFPVAVIFSFVACATVQRVPSPIISRGEIESRLSRQSADWSAGRLDAFVSIYKADAVFVSPSGVTRGRAPLLERYQKKYPTAEAMGNLSLDIIEFSSSQNSAQVVAEWRLRYPEKPEVKGHTLLVFERVGEDVQIAYDASM